MAKFIGRQRELTELDEIVTWRPSQFILVYGRRRVGKTTLVLHWAKSTGRPVIYWVAARDTPAQVRQGFVRAIWNWAHPGELGTPRYDNWEEPLRLAASLIGDQPAILIMDEFSYAAESDPSLPSYLQAAWDHQFKNSNATLIVTGSHIGMMVNLTSYDAPLYGRFTARLPVDPLPFTALQEFLPRYSIAERVAAYSIVGGIPAYLEPFDDTKSLGGNIQRLLFRRSSMFHSEPFFLIGDVIRRETQTYESVLKAVASGHRTPQEIGLALGVTSSYLSPYLKQLELLHLVDRRIPATIPRERRRTSRTSRYHLADPYLRFYFRFLAPNQDLVEQELSNVLWERIRTQFRAYVGLTAFEELCREWTLVQARADKLPFPPEIVGSHWSKNAQVDVVALNWHDKGILLGECKWGEHAVGRSVVRELVDKAPLIMPDKDWHAHYVLFARAGFTDAAQAEAASVGAQLVDLNRLDADLRLALESSR